MPPREVLLCSAVDGVPWDVTEARDGVPQVAKVAAIAAQRRRTDVTSVKAFSRVVNYNRQFIPNCSRLQSPLKELTKKGVAWTWGTAQEEAFGALKVAAG